jgi:hypothetical protein
MANMSGGHPEIPDTRGIGIDGEKHTTVELSFGWIFSRRPVPNPPHHSRTLLTLHAMFRTAVSTAGVSTALPVDVAACRKVVTITNIRLRLRRQEVRNKNSTSHPRCQYFISSHCMCSLKGVSLNGHSLIVKQLPNRASSRGHRVPPVFGILRQEEAVHCEHWTLHYILRYHCSSHLDWGRDPWAFCLWIPISNSHHRGCR